MKYNLEHFSEIMDNCSAQIPEKMKTEDKFLKLASHKGEDIDSENVQNLVQEIIAFTRGNAPETLIGDDKNYCQMIIDAYSNDYLKRVFDTKYGDGTSDYIVQAFRCHCENNCS